MCGPAVSNSDGLTGVALPGRQGRLLFAYLVLNRTRGCPRDELIDVLWPEGPPAAADSALSALLSKLRRALGDGVLTGRGELRLRLGAAVGSTSRRSRAAILEAEAAMEAGGHDAAAEARERSRTDLQTFLPDARRAAGRPSSAASWRRSGCARWRRWPRPGCARAGASSARPSRPRAPRSPPRPSASPRTGC